jgi:hypothetical protein
MTNFNKEQFRKVSVASLKQQEAYEFYSIMLPSNEAKP